MIVYAINEEIKSVDKTKQIVCSTEVKGSGYRSFRVCAKILQKQDIYCSATSYMTKKHFDSINKLNNLI